MEEMNENKKDLAPRHIDYKDITKLRALVNPHARMMSRKRTGLSAGQQRNFATAVKRARFMALMPYVSH